MSFSYIAIFWLISAICCCIGFKKYVYFLSVGYGLSVAGLGITYFITALVGGYTINLVTFLQCALFVAYGARLSGFLIVRELKNGNYRAILKEATKEGEKPMPIFVLVAMWVCVSFLYVIQTLPVFCRVYNEAGDQWTLPLIGAIISAAGLILEAMSDKQKSAQKAVNPNMVATEGLFKLVRCPNYFGEIIFWTGVLVGALNALSGAAQWILSIIGYVCIVYIMINGAQRLDRRQEGRYGHMSEYRNYADNTPIIIPFLPVYHIGKYK